MWKELIVFFCFTTLNISFSFREEFFGHDPHLLYHPLGMSRACDNRVTTEIVANISRKKKGDETFVPTYFAICTLDGKLIISVQYNVVE